MSCCVPSCLAVVWWSVLVETTVDWQLLCCITSRHLPVHPYILLAILLLLCSLVMLDTEGIDAYDQVGLAFSVG